MFRAKAENLFICIFAATGGGDGDDDPVVLAVELGEFAFLGDVEVEGADAELGPAVVVFATAPDAGDIVAKRDQPLAKRFADVAAADDQYPHTATVSLGQAEGRIILDFAGCGVARTFCGGT